MCALLGCDLEDVTEENLQTLRLVALESQVRGKHAFGVSFIGNNGLETITEPVCAEKFLNTHAFRNYVADGCLTLIGHCRYSTSDLLYNQPIYADCYQKNSAGKFSSVSPEMWWSRKW